MDIREFGCGSITIYPSTGPQLPEYQCYARTPEPRRRRRVPDCIMAKLDLRRRHVQPQFSLVLSGFPRLAPALPHNPLTGLDTWARAVEGYQHAPVPASLS